MCNIQYFLLLYISKQRLLNIDSGFKPVSVIRKILFENRVHVCRNLLRCLNFYLCVSKGHKRGKDTLKSFLQKQQGSERLTCTVCIASCVVKAFDMASYVALLNVTQNWKLVKWFYLRERRSFNLQTKWGALRRNHKTYATAVLLRVQVWILIKSTFTLHRRIIL